MVFAHVIESVLIWKQSRRRIFGGSKVVMCLIRAISSMEVGPDVKLKSCVWIKTRDLCSCRVCRYVCHVHYVCALHTMMMIDQPRIVCYVHPIPPRLSLSFRVVRLLCEENQIP